MTDIDYECLKCGSHNLTLYNNSIDDMGICNHITCKDCGFDDDNGYRSEWWLEEQKDATAR